MPIRVITGYRTLIALRRNQIKVSHMYGHVYMVHTGIFTELPDGTQLRDEYGKVTLRYDPSISWMTKDQQSAMSDEEKGRSGF